MSKPRRVLVVEDDRHLWPVVASMMSARALEVRCVASSREALGCVAGFAPDVIVVDLGLPDLDGVDLIALLHGQSPAIPIVVLTVSASEARIMAALRAGACGYLFKEDIGSRLVHAIADAFDGGAPMSPAVARLVLEQLRAPHAPAPASEPGLTAREREVVAELARGLTYEEIGASFGVSVNTVRTHIRSIYDKLDASTKTEAVMAALRRGLLTS